jgi:integrase/recombinase XerD
MNKPLPILEFHKPERDRLTTSKPTQPPSDLRWLRVEEFFNAKTIAPNTKKAYEREFLL